MSMTAYRAIETAIADESADVVVTQAFDGCEIGQAPVGAMVSVAV